MATASYTTSVDVTAGARKKTKLPAKAAVPSIKSGEHGRYLIKSGMLANEFVARAFPKLSRGSRGLIAEAKGATEELAIEALQNMIDEREVQRVQDRRKEPRTGCVVLNAEEYIEAMGQVVLSKPQKAMLKALSLADGEGLSEARMARAAGFKSETSAVRSFANAGMLVANYLSAAPAFENPSVEPKGFSVLAFREAPGEDGKVGNLILHREMREAMRVVTRQV